MDAAIDPTLVERFRADLARVAPDGAARIGIAVSGGPDSLALLLLAHAAMPGAIAAATVDHGLRPESASEAAMVGQVCARLGIYHDTLHVELARGNVQDAARQARYAALGSWALGHGLDALATAHHADDQAETLVMRLNRGSGVSGLAGVRATTRVPGGNLPLLRPLLGWRRAELAALMQAAGLEPAHDPSNRDDRFDRVRIRRALADADWLDSLALSRSADHLADADDALRWAAEREWAERVAERKGGYFYRPQAPRAVRLRVLARAIGLLGGAPRGSAVAALDDALKRGASGNCGGVAARCADGGWLIVPEPPRSAAKG